MFILAVNGTRQNFWAPSVVDRIYYFLFGFVSLCSVLFFLLFDGFVVFLHGLTSAITIVIATSSCTRSTERKCADNEEKSIDATDKS